jgi:hypothetical protein
VAYTGPQRDSAAVWSVPTVRSEAETAIAASFKTANQRQRIQAIVDDWPKMTGDERKRMLALIFMEIRADHVGGKRLLVTFKPWPHWEPYVDAVLARKAATESAGDRVETSERKTGVKHAEVVTARLVLDERGWLRLAS